MPSPALASLSLVEVGRRIETGALTSAALLDSVLERIAGLNPRLNAFTTLVPPEEARAAARAADAEIARGHYRGPLHGVPVGVKDLIDTAGLRTTYGSGMFRDHVPTKDGAIPERLRALGAILLGKTATHEFGKGMTTNNYFYGTTRNPWNLEHVPGGSSGGAGAATAACLGPLQIGTDGGGSIRFPAAFCGVVALKPTLGLISNRGHTGGGDSSFSVPGPMTRSVRDAALAAQALAGFDPGYLYSRPGPTPDLLADLAAGVRGLRVGTSPDLLSPEPDPDVRAAYEATLRRLESLGARLIEVSLPHQELVFRAVMALFNIEGSVLLEARLGDRPRLFSPQVERMNEAAGLADAATCIRASQDRQRICRDYFAAFHEVDVLLAPTAPCPAPAIAADEIGYVVRCVSYSGAANVTGCPAVTLPAGFSDGLPVAVQVIAPIGADALALRVAHALEETAPEHRAQLPPLAA
jgi:aspartyl-tRNA(Asn)/glutamyl-tRNA(Gln) amidotransferase subunit A